MTETENQEPQLIVKGQYVKDLSFEVPGAPAIYSELTTAPEIPIHVDIAVNPAGDTDYEVTLHLKAEAHINGKPVFIVEIAYAGMFSVNMPEEQSHPVLLVECPRLLFPFARTLVATLTREGGFPPLMIQPLDFAQLYRSRMAELARQEQAAGQHEPGNA
jgi:preprotein translocase subunit SecB